MSCLIQLQERGQRYPTSRWYQESEQARQDLAQILAEPSGVIWLRLLENPPIGPESVWRWTAGTFTRTENR